MLSIIPSRMFFTRTFSGKISPPKLVVENEGISFNVCMASTKVLVFSRGFRGSTLTSAMTPLQVERIILVHALVKFPLRELGVQSVIRIGQGVLVGLVFSVFLVGCAKSQVRGLGFSWVVEGVGRGRCEGLKSNGQVFLPLISPEKTNVVG